MINQTDGVKHDVCLMSKYLSRSEFITLPQCVVREALKFRRTLQYCPLATAS